MVYDNYKLLSILAESKKVEANLVISKCSSMIFNIDALEWAPGIWSGMEGARININGLSGTIIKVDLQNKQIHFECSPVDIKFDTDVVFNQSGSISKRNISHIPVYIRKDGSIHFIDQDDDEKTVPNFKIVPGKGVQIDDEGMIISEEEAKAIFGNEYQPKPWYDPYDMEPKVRDCSTGHHQFVKYTGLNETFFHCKDCGKKRD